MATDTDLAVDIPGLQALASRLRNVSSGLDNADDYLDHRGDAVGSDGLGDGLHHFASEWSDGIKDIRGEIDTVVSLLSGAAGAYGTNETNLSAGWDGGE